MEGLIIKAEPEDIEPVDEHFLSISITVKEEIESQDSINDGEKLLEPVESASMQIVDKSGEVVNIYECNKCKKRYINTVAFRDHVCCEPVMCDECHAIFKNSYGLEKHRIFHSSERQYVCNHCFGLFKSVGALKSHIAWRHGLRTTYKCKDCMFKCLYPDVLQHHALRCHRKKNVM